MGDEVESPRRTMPHRARRRHRARDRDLCAGQPGIHADLDRAGDSNRRSLRVDRGHHALRRRRQDVCSPRWSSWPLPGASRRTLLGAPRVYLAMARDGLFPSRLARFDVARGTSGGLTLLQVVLACGFVLLGTFNEILGYFVPVAVLFLGLSAAAVIVLPRPADGAPSSVRRFIRCRLRCSWC